jgi:acetyl-CoA synthetase
MPELKNNENSGIYAPPKAIIRKANIKEYDTLYAESINNREEFWAKQAKTLNWFRKWECVLDDSKAPFYKWFTGGRINIVHNAIDRHLKTWRRNKLALIWEGEPGDVRTFS